MSVRSLFHDRTPRLAVNGRSSRSVEMLFYDEIGVFGITAKDVAEALAGIDAGTIHLRINSPGGDVFAGVAIYNQIRQHPARVVTHIDGLAASIASVVALAGDEVRMASNAFFMIHNPWGITIGDAPTHRKMADTLEKLSADAIVSAYTAKTGKSFELVEAWMDEETWFNAKEAEEIGFADVVDKEVPAEARLGAFDLSVYNHVPVCLTEECRKARQEQDGPVDWNTLLITQQRELEAILRDEGFSRKDAEMAVLALRKLCQRDVDTPEKPPRDEVSPGSDTDALAAALAVLGNMASSAINRTRWDNG